MFVISGYVQNYAWGIPGGLDQWLPEPSSDQAPQAELWFGAHPNGPSPLVGADGKRAEQQRRRGADGDAGEPHRADDPAEGFGDEAGLAVRISVQQVARLPVAAGTFSRHRCT